MGHRAAAHADIIIEMCSLMRHEDNDKDVCNCRRVGWKRYCKLSVSRMVGGKDSEVWSQVRRALTPGAGRNIVT